ncbi:TetR/AcrR family transcriptional regulator [Anaerocolumna xylanovorans]|uniref:Transcriptional regulator, TetR family n=1 Tax=Anaerocolumna xylanovorans DSM 12503 TaxID=1121345 RepID=A0A1M7Y8E4_9FIRM|nr:TetR/AcrR family transcriptional regulator [Anaerocolumna xylanovorans]SHO48890.1 transcriptional regulator, TetR family [Anaerocolumna xylanovorans DSM 12503]
MGTIERKAKEKEIRKDDIIQAAEHVFFTKGYSASTMDDVAKEAQFSKRTLYMYFSSKEQIYFEIMTRGYRLFLAMLVSENADSGSKNPLEGLKALFYKFYSFSKEYPHHFQAIMEYQNREIDFSSTITSKSKEECYQLGEEVLKHLIKLLREGISDGTFLSVLNPEKTALILWSCTLGIFNTADKKENYLKNYYNLTGEELINGSYSLILGSILNKNN